MLKEFSIFMMLLIVAASLVGISSVYQHTEGQAPPAATPKPKQQAQRADVVIGKVNQVTIYASSVGKACLAAVEPPSNRPNELGIRPGGTIELLAPNESFCTLFGQSKIGKTIIFLDVERLTTLGLPSTLREDFPPDYQYLYRAIQVRM